MRALLGSFARTVAYAIAVLIIIAAILVTVSRMLTPIVEEHKADIEKQASQLLTMPVTIAKVRLSWYQYQPQISLNQVTILNQETKKPVLQIKSVRVFISIPKSLWQRRLVLSGLMLTGTEVNVKEGPTGEIVIQGFPVFQRGNQAFPQDTKFSDVMGFLMTQPRIILRNIDVHYVGVAGLKRFVTLYNLSLKNTDTDHTLLGKAILHQDLPTEVTIVTKWFGNSVDLSQIRARIYLYVSGFSFAQWLKGFSWQGWQLNEGIGSAKIWAVWNQGKFRRIQTTFQLYNVNLYSLTDKSTHIINRTSGNLGWKLEGESQVFAGNDILIDLPSHLWPVTSFYISLIPDGTGKLSPKALNIGYVNLSDVQSLLFSSPKVFSDSTYKMLADLKLKGSLLSTSATFSGVWNDWQHVSFASNVSQIGFEPWNKLPGISNLSGLLKWNGTQGSFSLQSNRVIFKYDSVFANAINLDQLSGDILWRQQENQSQTNKNKQWQFAIHSLQMLNSDAAANVNGTITIPPDLIPIVDLKANFTMQKASHISHYLPLQIFYPELVKWLREAFLSGEVRSGNAELQGKISNFPFDSGDGHFQITGQINNVDFLYAPDWPIVKHINGQLIFSGRKMEATISQAQILDIPITNVHGIIPSLGGVPQLLEVQSNEISTDFAKALKFVHTSPLEGIIGKIFSGVEAAGPIKLNLQLTIPLDDPAKTNVRGDVSMTNAQLNLVPWALVLEKLNGRFNFTENSAQADHIKGFLFNKPVDLSLKTLRLPKNVSVIKASMANNLSVTDLERWLKIPFSKVVQGSADVNADIDFSVNQPIKIQLRSDLVGIAVNLPDQYAKQPQTIKKFTADIEVREKQPLRMKVSYGGLLGAALVLDRRQDTYHLASVNLQLGAGIPDWPVGPGLFISGDFDQLDWNNIKQYASESGEAKFGDLTLQGIDVHTKTLKIGGQRFSQVRLQVTPSGSNWDIDIMSPEILGEIIAPTNLTPQGTITANFQKLNVQSVSGADLSTMDINAKSLPSISFVANNVDYDGINLGRIAFKTMPSRDGLTIQNLHINSANMDFQATGEWTEANTTRLQGNIKSSNVSDLLSSFKLNVRNFISNNGNLEFKFNWRGAPFAPSLAALNGSASLDLGKGRIVEISQASGAKMDIGRMLSIFSLQTIPRRLSLDFTDIFQKGYSFDYVKGNFTFRNGDAYTNSLRFDGPLARVDINGRIGLRNKDYDFTLSVTPYVSTSLPVAATTLLTGVTGPVGSLAALAVTTVLNQAVSKAATYYYEVSGPWDNPSWKTIPAPGK